MFESGNISVTINTSEPKYLPFKIEKTSTAHKEALPQLSIVKWVEETGSLLCEILYLTTTLRNSSNSNCRFQISGLKSEAVLSLPKTRDLMFKFSKFLVPETFYGLARIENRVTVCYFHLELFCIFFTP